MDLPEPAYAALLFSPYCSVSDRLSAVLALTDPFNHHRDAQNHGRQWFGTSGGDFVNHALRMRTPHNLRNQRHNSLFRIQGC